MTPGYHHHPNLQFLLNYLLSNPVSIMAPGSFKHPREEDGGPSRPTKTVRVGEGTREQAIVLDDSDNDGSDLTLVENMSRSMKTEEVRLAGIQSLINGDESWLGNPFIQ